MTVVGGDAPPSLADAATQIGLAVSDLNERFGVVLIDPDRKLYAVEVRADRLPSKEGKATQWRGPFANPPIKPLSPGKGRSQGEEH
jgi:hypothetical protein